MGEAADHIISTQPNAGTLIDFMGHQLTLDAMGCLFWEDEKLLVVSDLHLEKGSSFAERKGIFMPPYDTQATLEALALRIAYWNPKAVISLGDSFHDENASSRLPNSYKQNLTQLMQGREWYWISGNHDPKAPKDLGGHFCEELHIGGLNFCHEPKEVYKAGEIAGHLHPSSKIRQRGKTLRRKCFIANDTRMIMPAFGAFTGGLNVLDKAYASLFEARQFKSWMLSGERIYEFAGSQLVS